MLKAEQEEYKAEGVAWQTIAYRDNAVVLALLEHKPMGALALLDEEWYCVCVCVYLTHRFVFREALFRSII